MAKWIFAKGKQEILIIVLWSHNDWLSEKTFEFTTFIFIYSVYLCYIRISLAWFSTSFRAFSQNIGCLSVVKIHNKMSPAGRLSAYAFSFPLTSVSFPIAILLPHQCLTSSIDSISIYSVLSMYFSFASNLLKNYLINNYFLTKKLRFLLSE